MNGFFLKWKNNYWSKVITSSDVILYVFWLLSFSRQVSPLSFVCLQLAACVVLFQWNSPSLILFMFNSLYFWTLFKYARAFNLPMQNASHSGFVSPAKLNVLLTIPSCRSLAGTWNTNIFKSKSRKKPTSDAPPLLLRLTPIYWLSFWVQPL